MQQTLPLLHSTPSAFILPQSQIQDERNFEKTFSRQKATNPALQKRCNFVSWCIIIYHYISIYLCNIYEILLDNISFLKYACGW